MFAQNQAAIAQLGERQTEDLQVPGSIPGLGMLSCLVGQPVVDCTSLALFWMSKDHLYEEQGRVLRSPEPIH